ncbi:PTS glucitol/sorbitol transporter subunit IIA [Oceanobacillus sp. FSL W8-0428]|uniref:PTS sorbitol transporter subunit IIA n=1 Tax=Oceanobacillus sojae TaxID=582851 RepID=A0A511ZEJ0_9BACI|nr:PTS glucitol/sorbitol transporter subunit IIA [Oceanobacillus sojae]GEN85831.1 PTS sorbitol transporter subunit IIA [Oceanobacillus sojae]
MIKMNILEIGALVPDFEEENLLVLFNETVPPELRDISVIHRFEEQPKDALEFGKIIVIGGREYTIQKVGEEANSNFESLGHLSIYFKDDKEEEILPGAVLVTPSDFPILKEGDSIQVK